MVGDAAVAPMADGPLTQEVILAQLHMGTVGDRDIRSSPETGKIEPGVLVDDVPRGGLELLDVDVLGVDPAQRVSVDALRGVASGLAHPSLQPKPKTANRYRLVASSSLGSDPDKGPKCRVKDEQCWVCLRTSSRCRSGIRARIASSNA